MTFWCRRCTLQSRSKRCITLPWVSARICTSMWRGLITACSRYSVGSPNADSASRDAASIASGNAAASMTRRMPRPPPPDTALTNNGNSIVAAAAINSSADDDGADESSTGNPGRRDRPRLIARQLEDLRARTHECDARRGTRRSQVGVLRQEAVTRIDGVGTGLLGDANDFVDRKIRPDWVALLTDLIRLVGLEPVQGVAILIRIDRDRRDAHLIGGPERADSDLPAVGDQKLRNHPLTLIPDDAVVSR